MIAASNSTTQRKTLIHVLIGVIGIVFVAVMDKVYWHTAAFEDSIPNLHRGHLARSLVILVSVWIMLRPMARGISGSRLTGCDARTFERPCLWVALCMAFVFALVFLIKPPVFSRFSMEDSGIEWGSFLLWFLSSLVFIISAVINRTKPARLKPSTWLLLLPALGFLVFAMEEVSWFQRELDVATPEIMSANEQGEMNLHNFSTDIIENAFYCGAFIFTVLIPFARLACRKFPDRAPLAVFVPRPFILIAGSLACAYNYDMWNVILTQAEFWGAVVMLAFCALRLTERVDRMMALGALVLTVSSQTLFLANGANFQRIWEVTEYKEFLIPMACLLYSLDVLRQIMATPLGETVGAGSQ